MKKVSVKVFNANTGEFVEKRNLPEELLKVLSMLTGEEDEEEEDNLEEEKPIVKESKKDAVPEGGVKEKKSQEEKKEEKKESEESEDTEENEQLIDLINQLMRAKGIDGDRVINAFKALHTSSSERRLVASDFTLDTGRYNFLLSLMERNLAEVYGETPEGALGIIFNLYGFHKAPAFSILLRELAVQLDTRYEHHIKKCSVVYVISMKDGKIKEILTNEIKDFNNFACFRTYEDARFAKYVLRPFLTNMFLTDRFK